MTDDRIDRYARGELTAEEARELAQESLGSPELFEELAYSAVAKTALSSRRVVRFPHKVRFAAAIAAVAAAIAVVSLYSVRPGREIPPLKPALALSAKPGQPILLASDLRPQPDTAPVFRGADPDSRAPLEAGVIVSIEDGFAIVNLGSLDGLAKGAGLQVFRDERSTEPIGRLVVTTVFRERARSRIAGGHTHVNDQVRVPGAEHLNALLERIDALSGRGDTDAARILADSALRWAVTAGVTADEKRKAEERLAALDNQVAVASILRGDYAAAEAPLTQAASLAYPRSMNNLGVLAEVRGDRRRAEALYSDALRASTAQDRQAVETNLGRVRGSR